MIITPQADMKEITLRRSSSEKKLAKEKKKERKEKSRSVHFDGNGKKSFNIISLKQVLLVRWWPNNPAYLYNRRQEGPCRSRRD